MKIYDFDGKKNICGERIHRARTSLRLSQADLAARLQVAGVGVEREAISKMETGERFVADYELLKLAEVLNVSVLWLLGLDD